jgi:hypothetical protein
VCGGVFRFTAFNPGATRAWSRRHVALDAALIVPRGFGALAYLTDVTLRACGDDPQRQRR